MNSTAGLGPVAAIGVGVALLVHADAAAGAAGHVRPLGVLAVRPDARRRRAAPSTASGRASARRIDRAPRADLDRHLARCSRVACARHGRSSNANGPDHRGVVPRHAAVDRRARRCSPRTSPAAPATPVARHRATPTRRTRSARPFAGADGHRPGSVAEPQVNGRPGLHRGHADRRAPDSQAAYDTVDRVRDARARGAGRGRAGRRQHRREPRRAARLRSATTC